VVESAAVAGSFRAVARKAKSLEALGEALPPKPYVHRRPGLPGSPVLATVACDVVNGEPLGRTTAGALSAVMIEHGIA
jgi:hypothetical protein